MKISPLTSRINCSISNSANHFSDEELYFLFKNIKQTKKLTNRQKFAINAIKTETTSGIELEWFAKDYNINTEDIKYLLGIDPYVLQ